ncbi:class II fructose-bisphosphate aldolase [Acutalibacter sp. 1XD8-36]|uniref:class II fructose-bisphosphate aldolase n=1 Tax=Acutalibacter sp. 1XD8-36 TaxID=2320852 RepID=UPI00262F8409|nr:class II fructose-bisphosphate aldolase [Acutalibacter sp. 1XD8-36]
MPLVTTKDMLIRAKRGGYAVGAFNAENMEMAQAIIFAAKELNAPVIIQTTPSTLRYASLDLFWGNIEALAKNTGVPVALHLDHGDSFDLCAQALRAGYTSVMIDGSRLPLDQNIALTRRVVEICSPSGVPVEGEIGCVGGKEDDSEGRSGYTVPAEAVSFESETGVSSMAVGIGTAHGVYRAEPVLDMRLLRKLVESISSPLVLHGASGLTDSAIRECVREGICKVNFATELRIAYSEGVRQVLCGEVSVFDPKTYGKSGRSRVQELVMERIKVCGCDGKAAYG